MENFSFKNTYVIFITHFCKPKEPSYLEVSEYLWVFWEGHCVMKIVINVILYFWQ